jgi:DNA-binding transcriptional LysR family regulator
MWQIDQVTLRLFIAVCEEGTIARAAEREFIAPSAVSKRLADLEALVDVALLSRGQRGVRATAAGEALLRHARLIMRGHERLQAELSEYAAGARGHVRVLANVSSMVEFLPEALSVFLRANPAIRVDVEERVSADIVRGVEEGVADLGICRDTVPLGSLHTLPCRADHLALIVPRAHPLAGEPQIGFEQTLGFDHLGRASNASVNALVQRIALPGGSRGRDPAARGAAAPCRRSRASV